MRFCWSSSKARGCQAWKAEKEFAKSQVICKWCQALVRRGVDPKPAPAVRLGLMTVYNEGVWRYQWGGSGRQYIYMIQLEGEPKTANDPLYDLVLEDERYGTRIVLTGLWPEQDGSVLSGRIAPTRNQGRFEVRKMNDAYALYACSG